MTDNRKTIRTGLIGYGFAGKTFHAPLLRSVPGIELALIASSRPERVHADLPGIAVNADARDVATHPELDLIVIASPNDSHFPLAQAALLAGKHVVIDKPFTVTLADARALVALAEKENRLLSVFHNRRHDSEYLAAKAVLDSGVLGEIAHHELHIDRFRPNVRQRWREDVGPGAGLWFDLGPHLIDQSLQLFGLPESVNANFGILRAGGQTDDWAHIQLNYDRLRVSLHTTLLAADPGPRAILHGTRGSWIKQGADVQEPQLIAGMMPGDPGYGIDPDPGILIDGATGERKEIRAPAGDQSLYYAGIRDALLGRAPSPVPPIQALAVMAVLEATFESGAQGRTLTLPLTEAERIAFEASISSD